MEKKYQVFVSSTYEDLRPERQEVMQALLELDCIPSGMELFPAANEDQWSLIRDVIDECDYYIVIVAGRYGSTDGEGVSYTEKEYRYALETNKPIIGFLHKDPAKIPVKDSEPTDTGKEKLKAFRELVSSKVCKFWDSPAELGSVVSRSMVNLQRKHPGVGWIRGDVTTDKEASLQIIQLNNQIEKLKTELSQIATKAPAGTEKLAQGEDEFSVRFRFNALKQDGWRKHSYEGHHSYSWNELFYQISPLLIHEATDRTIRTQINEFLEEDRYDELCKKPLLVEDINVDENQLSDFEIVDEDFQTIKVQLRALGLIEKNDKNRSVKDTQLYWTLTAFGDHIMNQLRAIKREPANAKEPTND
jgi:hypothetical protein